MYLAKWCNNSLGCIVNFIWIRYLGIICNIRYIGVEIIYKSVFIIYELKLD